MVDDGSVDPVTAWPPLTTKGKLIAGNGVHSSDLGTIKRSDGSEQVTYKGHPLYTFASDKKPGQVKGEGLKDVGVWHAAFVPAPKQAR